MLKPWPRRSPPPMSRSASRSGRHSRHEPKAAGDFCEMPFEFFVRQKPVIAMAHIGALPGAPLYDAAGGADKLIAGVLADVEKLQDGGVDAIMFGNENDRPYVFAASLEGIAAMTAVVQ